MNKHSATIGIFALALLCVAWSWTALLAEPKAGEKPPLDPDHAAKMMKGLEIFEKHVRPVLVQSCVKCHGGKRVEGEFDLNQREGLLKGGTSGPAILAGNAKDSLLYKLITHAREPHMPHERPKLAAEVIAQIAGWIENGAPYADPLVAEKAKGPSWTQKVLPVEARQFWSFQPLQRVQPPPVKNEAGCRTSIDRFLVAKLEAAGIEPNPPIEKRALIRRASFDLLGLPPSPAEVEAFLGDASPNAYEQLIDRLLASQHYGERWGRHWLDLARFAESHGFEHDTDRPSAYHYRDFVIQALNDDLPYDKFVKWQIAGDEYEPENNLALKATGFLAAGVHSTQITKNEVEKHRYDELDDMSQTVGTAMLGLTIGCARCHDHKFDPIPQRDYYRMAATFTTTVRSEVDLNLDPEGWKVAKASFDRDHAPLAAELKKFEVEQLPARLAEWEKTGAGQERFSWVILDLVSFQAKDGCKLTKLEDGSLLASGKNPDFDRYTLVAHTDLTGITGIRLEALADPSMVKGGPGRAKNGNFDLTDFRVSIAPRNGKGSGEKPIEVPLSNPRASFEQPGLPVKAAIDKDEKSGWAIDPQFGKDHAAAFDTEAPIGFEGGTVLTFTLRFNGNNGHNIGRPRLAITTRGSAVGLQGPGVGQSVQAILQLPADRRTMQQQSAVLKWYATIDPEWQKLNQKVLEHLRTAPKPKLVKALISSEGLPAVRLFSQGADFFNETYFLKRGDPEQKEGVASQGFLQVLTAADNAEKHWQAPPPSGWRTSYRRRALAEWLTDVDQGAGRLLARVIVNRLWQHHLGRGIVGTPSDFGIRGESPTHPELLDWLATELIRNGWRLKPIHKLIMTSAVYRQSSKVDPAKAKVDADNKLLWRHVPHRLEAEVIRDAMLAVSGSLDAKMFGPGTLDETSKRRSIYFTVKRSKLITMMQVFDAPEALGGVGDRPTTTIAPQALLLMNNPNVRGQARNFARRIAPDEKTTTERAVQSGYLMALTRLPGQDEVKDGVQFVSAQMESYKAAGKADARELALADFCQVLMCLNEFVYVD